MVCLVINGKTLPHAEILVKNLKQALPEVVSIFLSHHQQPDNVVLGKEMTLLDGKPFIIDQIGDLKFQIAPLSFFQVNPLQTKVLYDKVLEFANLNADEIVWDAYCGIGSISLFLAQHAKHVYGVEIVPEAIENAKANAKLNGLINTTFYTGKAEEVIPQLYQTQGIKADTIVVDPPRKGCDINLLETILKMSPAKVVYVSCDPATLARDLAYLTQNGYEVKKVQPVDMFPMTHHVETVCLMSRKDK
jgi:23S rRNA (uracil1939-C5)-methyltransferase